MLLAMHGTAKCPEPICRAQALLVPGWFKHHLEGHYPLFIAHTSSCAKPAPPPEFVYPHLFPAVLQVAASPCWELVPDVISSNSFPGCLSPDPVGLQGATAVSSPASSAFPKSRQMGRLPESARKETSCGRCFGIVAIPY